jgi:hypothetical protein
MKATLNTEKNNRLVKSLFFGLIMLSLAACQPNKGNDSTSTTSGPRTSPAAQSQGAASGIALKGIVYTDPSFQDDFNEMVRYFMEGSVPHDYIGFVSAQATSPTGMFIGLKVDLANGATLQSATNPVGIAASSRILISVFDMFQGSQNPRAIPSVFLGPSTNTNSNSQAAQASSVSNTRATLVFADDYGSVTLDGQFDNTNFSGTFSFTTTKLYDGSSTNRTGTVGAFIIPKCQVFRCN